MTEREPEAEETLDLGTALGAEAGTSTQVLTLYIQNETQDGREIGDQRRWVLEAATLLAQIGGGVTVMPPAEGGWVDDSGAIVWEHPVLAYTFVKPDAFVLRLPELRDFLHRMGRETEQGEVAFEFDGFFYRICKFDRRRRRRKRHG